MYSKGNGHSDAGRVRDNNEDAFWIDDEQGVYVVSDGMGGHASGEVASVAAVEKIKAEIENRRRVLARFQKGDGDIDALEHFVRELVNGAAEHVYQMALENRAYHNMGCTLTLLIHVADKIVIGHVGDSRAYLFRFGSIHQLTRDHTLAAELAESGAIDPSEVEESRYAHVLTRAIGHQAFVKVDTLCMNVIPQDKFLLCSDGLSGHLETGDELIPHLSSTKFEQTAISLVDFANEMGGQDNITAVVIEIRGTEAERSVSASELKLIFGALETDFIFQDLYLSRLVHLKNACRFKAYQPGDVVITEGAPSAQLHIIVNGRVSLTRRGVAPLELSSGQVFGGTTLLCPRPCRATVQAVAPTTLLTLEREDMTKLLQMHPRLGLAFMERFATILSKRVDETYIRTQGAGTGAGGENLVAPYDLF